MNFTPINNDAITQLSESMPPRIRANARSVILEILLKARRKDGHFEGYELKRGDVKLSIRKLPGITGVSRQSCKTIFAHLKECGFLTHKVTHPDTVVSIYNFDTYINDNIKSNPLSNPQVTHLQPTPPTIYERAREKEIKDIKKNNSKEVFQQVDEIIDQFNELFPLTWPGGSKRQESQRASDQASLIRLLNDEGKTIEDLQGYLRWFQENPKNIKYWTRPEKWINAYTSFDVRGATTDSAPSDATDAIIDNITKRGQQ